MFCVSPFDIHVIINKYIVSEKYFGKFGNIEILRELIRLPKMSGFPKSGQHHVFIYWLVMHVEIGNECKNHTDTLVASFV